MVRKRDDEIEAFLFRVRAAVHLGQVDVKDYAADRAAEEFGWALEDIFDVLDDLCTNDFRECQISKRSTRDLIWVFTPEYEVGRLWIRLIERDQLVVVSFHLA